MQTYTYTYIYKLDINVFEREMCCAHLKLRTAVSSLRRQHRNEFHISLILLNQEVLSKLVGSSHKRSI